MKKVTNCCFDRVISLRVESEMVEVVLRHVGKDDLLVDHALGDDVNPGSRGPQ
jgi:hypothetical protein